MADEAGAPEPDEPAMQPAGGEDHSGAPTGWWIEHGTQACHQLGASSAMIVGFGKLLARGEHSPDQVKAMATEIEQAAKQMVLQLQELQEAAAEAAQPRESAAPGDGRAEQIEQLQAQLAATVRQRADLENELTEARLAQQQLQSYADDFRRTYAESRHRLQQMTTLYEVSTGISATVDPGEVLVRTVEGFRRLLPEDNAAIYLLEDDGRVAHRQAGFFALGAPEPPETVVPEQGPVGRCLASGQAVLEGSRPQDGRTSEKTWALALPLSAGNQQLGALLLVRQADQPLADEDRYLAEMVASQSAMALQNARLATTDALTGLYNRRYFEKTLAFECERTRRAGRPIGLLMLDIDFFKDFNEQFGHPAGDEVLRLVAGTLASQLRRTDIVARVGGEEFVAILPENDYDAVAVAAERLRRAVELRPPLLFDGHKLPGVKVSVGGVSLGPEQATPRALTNAADTALLKAKRTGRNRIEMADTTAGGDCA